MSPANEYVTLDIEGLGVPLSVRALHGEERLSRPFWFEAEGFTAGLEGVRPGALLGKRAQFVLPARTGARTINAVVAEAWASSVATAGRGTFVRVRLVPRLAVLDHVKRSRIFQNVGVKEIVEQ